jgi:hypothetical protein
VDEPASHLARTLAVELALPVPEQARRLAEELRRRHGTAVAAILFYGSCLRTGSTQGVLDFYLLVDSYTDAYRSRALAFANALLPPNVLYCELPGAQETLRAKYAVMTLRHFARAASPRSLDGRVSARFCQPAALVYARDEAARRAVVAAVERATLTMVDRMRSWLAGSGSRQRFLPADLWLTGFRETYRAELRSESPETIRGLYESAPARYDRVAREALRELARRGRLRLVEEGESLEIVSSARGRRRARRLWRVQRPLAKAIAIAGLLKTAATFGDWVPYVLWKLERQSGIRIEVSERQRRHPLIWGWPVIFRVLRQRILR